MSIELTIDMSARVAYIRLVVGSIAMSKAINEDIVVDLDEYDRVLGIEILDLGAEIPFSELIANHHVPSETVELLRRLRPSISGFMSSFSSDRENLSGSRVSVGSPT